MTKRRRYTILNDTGDAWCSKKAQSRLKEFIRDLGDFCDDPHERFADIVHSIHYDFRNHTITSFDGKKGLFVTLPDSPSANSFMLFMTQTQSMAKSADKSVADNAMEMLRMIGRLTVDFDTGLHTSENTYPNAGLLLLPHPGCKATRCTCLDYIPHGLLATVSGFAGKYGTGRSGWMVFDDRSSPRTKPVFCTFSIQLDRTTRAEALAFIVPDTADAPADIQDAASIVDGIISRFI